MTEMLLELLKCKYYIVAFRFFFLKNIVSTTMGQVSTYMAYLTCSNHSARLLQSILEVDKHRS